VRVSDAADGNPRDVSDGYFSIVPPPVIRVLSPNGGERWVVGRQQEIRWETENFNGFIRIEYSTDEGGSWKEVVAHTENDGVYRWTIPNTPSSRCLVRISDASDGDPWDISDDYFSIVLPIIRVLSPNGGERWAVGSRYEIRWETENFDGSVEIDYSIDGGGSWREIIGGISNGGSYEWEVPDTPSDSCLVRVMDAVDGDPADVSDDYFLIVEPRLWVEQPNGGEVWVVGERYEVQWGSLDFEGWVRIEYSVDGGRSWNVVVDSTEADGVYLWEIPDTPSDSCLVRVTDATDGNPGDISDSYFSIVRPWIQVERPNGKEKWVVGSRQEIRWEARYLNGGVRIEYSVDGGRNWSVIVDSTENDGVYEWEVPDTPSDSCLIRIMDAADGNPVDVCEEFFSIVRPWVQVKRPNGGEKWVVGNREEIQWETKYMLGGWVRIEYSADGGRSWSVVVDSTEDDGEYEWQVTSTPSDSCLIRVMDAADGDPMDVSDGYFSIVQPWVRVESPNGGEKWVVGSRHEIRWEGRYLSGWVQIEYSIDGGREWSVVVDSTEDDGVYEWKVPGTPSDRCLIRVVDRGNGHSVDESDRYFWICSGEVELRVIEGYGLPKTEWNRVDIALENAVGVKGLEFTLESDSTLLALREVRTTDRTHEFKVSFSGSRGKTHILLISIVEAIIAPGSGSVVEVFLDVSSAAALGDSTRLTLSEVKVVDENYWPMVAHVVDGRFYFRGPQGVNDQKRGVPKTFKLLQNYPNPFAEGTSIDYEIPKVEEGRVEVQLAIYNVEGQLVRILIDEKKDPGHYVTYWDRRDSEGKLVSSGIYFYRMSIGKRITLTKKMVILN